MGESSVWERALRHRKKGGEAALQEGVTELGRLVAGVNQGGRGCPD